MKFAARLSIWLILLTTLLVSSFVDAATKVKGVRIWPSPDSTRIVLDLSESSKYTYFSLENPNRLVVDLADSKLTTSLKNLKHDSKLLKTIRSSKKGNKTRLVFDLTKKIEPMLFALAPTAPYGHRLVIDLLDKKSKVAKVKTQKPRETNRDVVIAIDAGHGGEDPGSIGPKGNYEKKATLAIAKKLAAKINAEKGMKAVLTRTGDYYITIHGRTEKARKAGADLLVSIHADAFTTPQPSGASVWVLTLRRANSEIGKWLEKKEKHSQLLGGAADVIKDRTTEKYLARTLIDMSMDHSMEQGYNVAGEILGKLKGITKLHKRKPQAGNFGVLKSPDIPSILVETGFISNPKEEKLLTNGWFQNRMADSLHKAIKGYFKKNAPDGTYYAGIKDLKHKVKRGESLSLVAQNYKVSVSKIKQANNLKTDKIRVGQVLSIPKS